MLVGPQMSRLADTVCWQKYFLTGPLLRGLTAMRAGTRFVYSWSVGSPRVRAHPSTQLVLEVPAHPKDRTCADERIGVQTERATGEWLNS